MSKNNFAKHYNKEETWYCKIFVKKVPGVLVTAAHRVSLCWALSVVPQSDQGHYGRVGCGHWMSFFTPLENGSCLCWAWVPVILSSPRKPSCVVTCWREGVPSRGSWTTLRGGPMGSPNCSLPVDEGSL